jgi:hypothetical protein
LVIESFKTTDSDIVEYFKGRKLEDYERLLEKALRAGAIALGSVAVADKIDYVFSVQSIRVDKIFHLDFWNLFEGRHIK